jgi:hypothetical protein
LDPVKRVVKVLVTPPRTISVSVRRESLAEAGSRIPDDVGEQARNGKAVLVEPEGTFTGGVITDSVNAREELK